MSNVTGASVLSESFRTQLAGIKAKIGKAHDRMNTALSNLDDTADHVTEVAKQVETETADLQAAIGLHTNGPPA